MTLCSKLSQRPSQWPQEGVVEVSPKGSFPDRSELVAILSYLPLRNGSSGLRLCGACGLHRSCEVARDAVGGFGCLAFEPRQDLPPERMQELLVAALEKLDPDTRNIFPPPL